VSISTVPTWLHIPVISKHNNDEQYIWESAGNTFTITPDTINPLGGSTRIPREEKDQRDRQEAL
jgi:HSP90 family molecular chaperone